MGSDRSYPEDVCPNQKMSKSGAPVKITFLKHYQDINELATGNYHFRQQKFRKVQESVQ